MNKLLLFLLIIPSLSFADNTWHCVSRILTCHTWRMEIPSGWLVSGDNGSDTEYAMTYVPDPLHQWKI